MQALVCSVCGYIPLNGQAPDTCPVCGSTATAFKEQAEAIIEPDDPNNLQGLEQKHVPQLSLSGCGLVGDDCLDVHAIMGEVIHPMEEDHYITHIDIYIDKVYAGRIMLTPQSKPAGSFHVQKVSGTVTVIENCNKHGNWINQIDV